MNRVLVIDNYDSFTFNLVQLMGSLGSEVLVYRNNHELSEVLASRPTHIVISPGPKNPSHAGISKAVIEHFQGKIPVLGVCLGHQVIGEMNGAQVLCAPEPVHGETEEILHSGKGIFRNLSSPSLMARYHSLVVSKEQWPESLEITAWTSTGLVMGLRHRFIPNLEGVQFHPESFMSAEGPQLMRNFLNAKR